MSGSTIHVEPFDTLFRRLVSDRGHFVHALDFAFYGIGWRGIWNWDCDVYFDVPRAVLGLEPGVPGDVDILMVPRAGDRTFPEASVAIELKSFRVGRHNRDKSPSSFGRRQVQGLVDDGFPYVGLLHLAVIEHGGSDEHSLLPLWQTEKKYPKDAEPDEYVYADLSGVEYMFRHEGRLEKLDGPQWVGLKLHSVQLTADGNVSSSSIGHQRPVARNPYHSKALTEVIGAGITGVDKMRVGFPQPIFRAQWDSR